MMVGFHGETYKLHSLGFRGEPTSSWSCVQDEENVHSLHRIDSTRVHPENRGSVVLIVIVSMVTNYCFMNIFFRFSWKTLITVLLLTNTGFIIDPTSSLDNLK